MIIEKIPFIIDYDLFQKIRSELKKLELGVIPDQPLDLYYFLIAQDLKTIQIIDNYLKRLFN